MQRLIPWNTMNGLSKTIIAGYCKFSYATFILDIFGTSGTTVMVVHED